VSAAQLDMLALLADIEAPAGDTFHVLMPNMGFACGRDVLAEPKRLHRMVIGGWGKGWSKVNCPECRAFGPEALAEQSRKMQERQI